MNPTLKSEEPVKATRIASLGKAEAVAPSAIAEEPID